MFYQGQKGLDKALNSEMIHGLLERRSIRSFKKQQISEEELQIVLKTGMYAPTGRGLQGPIIVVVQDEKEQAAVSELNRVFNTQQDPYYSAPTILIVLAPRDSEFAVMDGSAVITNLCNGAHAVGLGACWIYRPHWMFETIEGKNMLRRWGVEGDWVGVGSVALGYIDKPAPPAKPRKENYCYYVR